MKRTWLIAAIALILIGCITAVCALAALDWDFSRFSTVAFETNTYPVTGDFHNISLRTETAHITVLPADGAEAYVVCREQENLRHTVTVTDGTLTVALSDDRKWYEYIGISTESSSVTLYLPEAEYGDLLIRGSTSDVGISEDFRFESMDVQVSTGDIRVDGIAAEDFSVTVSTGKAELSDIRCENLSAAGSTGDLLLKRVRASGSMRLSRDTGDIRLEACDAAELKIRTDTGDVTGTLTSDKVFLAESDTGTVRVPSSVAGGKCEITTDTGDIRIAVE